MQISENLSDYIRVGVMLWKLQQGHKLVEVKPIREVCFEVAKKRSAWKNKFFVTTPMLSIKPNTISAIEVEVDGTVYYFWDVVFYYRIAKTYICSVL